MKSIRLLTAAAALLLVLGLCAAGAVHASSSEEVAPIVSAGHIDRVLLQESSLPENSENSEPSGTDEEDSTKEEDGNPSEEPSTVDTKKPVIESITTYGIFFGNKGLKDKNNNGNGRALSQKSRSSETESESEIEDEIKTEEGTLWDDKESNGWNHHVAHNSTVVLDVVIHNPAGRVEDPITLYINWCNGSAEYSDNRTLSGDDLVYSADGLTVNATLAHRYENYTDDGKCLIVVGVNDDDANEEDAEFDDVKEIKVKINRAPPPRQANGKLRKTDRVVQHKFAINDAAMAAKLADNTTQDYKDFEATVVDALVKGFPPGTAVYIRKMSVREAVVAARRSLLATQEVVTDTEINFPLDTTDADVSALADGSTDPAFFPTGFASNFGITGVAGEDLTAKVNSGEYAMDGISSLESGTADGGDGNRAVRLGVGLGIGLGGGLIILGIAAAFFMMKGTAAAAGGAGSAYAAGTSPAAV